MVRLQPHAAYSNKFSRSNLVKYDNVSRSMGINSRLHWIPRQALLVLNYGLSDPDKDSTFTSVNADLSAKFN